MGKSKIILLAILTSLCSTVLLAGCGKESNSSTSSVNTISSINSNNVPSSLSLALSLGETTSIADFEIMATSVSYQKKISDNQYIGYTADEGSVYAVVNLEVKNTHTSSQRFIPTIAYGNSTITQLIYDNEYKYNSSVLLSINNDLHNEHLNPLETKKGILVFSVPEEISSSDKPLIFEIRAGSKFIQYNLR